ncbi:MAG: substrate-binding domain-containing protein [Chthoniobacterales bacterium]
MRKRLRIYVVMEPRTRYERGVYQGLTDYFTEKVPYFELIIVFHQSAIDKTRSLKGIITLLTQPKEADSFLSFGVPVVNISGYLESSKLPTVISDNEMSGRMAAEYLINCRFPHFGYHDHTPGHSFAMRGEGFKNAIARGGFPCSQHQPYKDVLSDFKELDVAQHRNLRKWISGLPKPVGIFSGSDQDAWEVWNVCQELDLKIGKDVGIIGHGNDEFYCETRHPYLSSVEIQPDRIGYETGALLLHLIRGGRPPSQAILVPPSGVVARESANVFLAEDSYVDMAIQFIRTHLEETSLIQQVFAHVPMTRRTLERRFNQCLNRTIIETIHELKIEHIKQLLDTTSMRLHEIAKASGFSNIYYMTRLFGKKVGLSPSKYRARFQRRTGTHSRRKK